MYLSYILIAFAAAVTQAAPIRDSTSRTANLSRDEIQHFLQARDQFMFDRKDGYQDVSLRVQTQRARRDGDCSTYPPEFQIFCISIYGDEEDYIDTPATITLKYEEVIGVDNFDSSQTGWSARRS